MRFFVDNYYLLMDALRIKSYMKFGPFSVSWPGSLLIKDVEIELDKQVYHIVGKNGTGKSTLLNCIVNECNIQSLEYAFINQNYRENWLWWKSIRQNLEFPLNIHGGNSRIEDNTEYQHHKDWLDPLLEKQNQVDFSLQSETSSVGVSGGQLQKLVFLRELILKPQLLFLDEAFSALDVEAVRDICQWLMEAQQRIGFKIVSISHDPKILEYLPGEILEVRKNKSFEVSVRNNPSFHYET